MMPVWSWYVVFAFTCALIGLGQKPRPKPPKVKDHA